MRDKGFDFYWQDPYTTNIMARGFELENIKYEAVTTFESFEHFVNPIGEIEKILAYSKNIVFSTEPLPDPIPAPADWWYYGFEHGQHLSFYSKKTFEFIAKKYNMHYYSFDNIHILSEHKHKNIFTLFFQNKIGKLLLYALSFPIAVSMKSLLFTDYNNLKKQLKERKIS
jgi:hypothetical protein